MGEDGRLSFGMTEAGTLSAALELSMSIHHLPQIRSASKRHYVTTNANVPPSQSILMNTAHPGIFQDTLCALRVHSPTKFNWLSLRDAS